MSFSPFDDPFSIGSGSSLRDIFARSRAGGGRRYAKPAPALEEDQPLEAASAEEEEEEEKAKAALKNPKWEVEEVGFNEETEISIEADIPEEHAHKTKVAFELFAKTPGGPESISRADGQAKDGIAKAKIPVYRPGYKDEEGNLLAEVEYYFTAKHSESDLFKDEKTAKTVDQMSVRLIESRILEDMTFATGKSFPRPAKAGTLQSLGGAVKAWRDQHPDAKVAVFGHADAVGEDKENKTLSERRARAIHAFLALDAAAWETLYGEEKWGLASIQELLKHLGHDPGALDGTDGPKTQAAVKDFQANHGLAVDGKAGPKTREALYRAYMEGSGAPGLKAKEFDAIDGKPFAGCGEFNQAEKNDGACEANRRVSVLLLKSSKDFPIQYPCKQGDCGPCGKQAGRKGDRKNAGFQCLFYDQLVLEEKRGGGAGGDGKVVEAYFENDKGEKVQRVKANQVIHLVLKSNNLTGKKVDIDFADSKVDFEYQGKKLVNDVLKELEITGDEMKIEIKTIRGGETK